ncbi:hypothetical protein CLV35_2938 [Motilibacter peucedani]|uniref:Uncharacterized protein n=1 Tax=Motilibacter peucedani TaxID=598650 RepID=A0A420XN46_9ACTN|nr:hypothetical protein [Motilibacter peucedani]RKS72689.1 hypothetical protein CLV35_2938 [Motilibacter peucedani]
MARARAVVVAAALGAALGSAGLLPAQAGEPATRVLGGPGFVPVAVNAHRVVLGRVEPTGEAQVVTRDGGLRTLRDPAGTTGSSVAGLDDSGTVTGGATGADGAPRVVQWRSPDYQPELLDLSPGAWYVADVDRGGRVLLRRGDDRSYVWRAGSLAAVADLTSGALQRATLLDPAGDLVDALATPPVLWTGGRAVALEAPAGLAVAVSDVEDGAVYGTVSDYAAGGIPARAVRWDASGRLHRLPLPAGTGGPAYASVTGTAGAHDRAAGTVCRTATGACLALTWRRDRLTVVGPGTARAVDGKGGVVGTAPVDGGVRGVLWKRHA